MPFNIIIICMNSKWLWMCILDLKRKRWTSPVCEWVFWLFWNTGVQITSLSAGLHTHAGCTAIWTVWLVCSSVGVVPFLILFLDQKQWEEEQIHPPHMGVRFQRAMNLKNWVIPVCFVDTSLPHLVFAPCCVQDHGKSNQPLLGGSKFKEVLARNLTMNILRRMISNQRVNFFFFFLLSTIFIFYFFTHNITEQNIQNKTKQNSRHILNISRFNQKGGREGRTTRTQKSLL